MSGLMQRTYFKYSLAKLTAITESAETANEIHLLELILEELDCRSTPGAEALSERIRVGLEPNTAPMPPAPNAPLAGLENQTDYNDPLHPKIAGLVTNSQSAKRRLKTRAPKHAPTPEQTGAIEAFMSGEDLKVTAFAGAGKTSTLVQMADVRDGSGIYLAFNKAIADEARAEFPTWVDCRTTHSLALNGIRGSSGLSQEKLFGQIRPKQLAQVLNLKKATVARNVTLTDIQQAHAILSVIRSYCQSGDPEILGTHVRKTNRIASLDCETKAEYNRWAITNANIVWRRMLSESDGLPLGHDGYLKLWSNSSPNLTQDFILLDEAQDTNPAVMKVINEQKCQRILVGDSHQQIYAWRGAVDAMEVFEAEQQAYLTQSFRFGPSIAEAASKVLCTLGETQSILGNPTINSKITGSGHVRAVLSRTNATVIAEVLGALEDGLKPHIIGGPSEMLRLVGDVFSLKAGMCAEHPDFFGFSKWDEVVDFSKTEEGGDLVTFVNLVEKFGEDTLRKALVSAGCEENNADVVISTAHKSKGRQWPSVRLASDFSNENSKNGEVSREDRRLFYVAMTRAQKDLCVCPEVLNGYITGKVPDKTDKLASSIAINSRPVVVSHDERSSRGMIIPNSNTRPKLETAAQVATAMLTRGYVRGPEFSSYADLSAWDNSNTRPHVRRTVEGRYQVYFTDSESYVGSGVKSEN